MNLDDIYSSWLKASMIKDRCPMQVTIRSWQVVEFDDKSKVGGKKRQIAIEVGERSPLGLNVTNARRVAHVLGSENPDQWVNQQITLVVEQVESFGKWEDAIRIQAGQPQQQYQQTGQQPQPFDHQVQDNRPGSFEQATNDYGPQQ